jgi:hypothetical protein
MQAADDNNSYTSMAITDLDWHYAAPPTRGHPDGLPPLEPRACNPWTTPPAAGELPLLKPRTPNLLGYLPYLDADAAPAMPMAIPTCNATAGTVEVLTVPPGKDGTTAPQRGTERGCQRTVP